MERVYRFFRKNRRLGLRVVKTGIAVTACVAISGVFRLEQPFIAVAATVMSMGKSIDLSVRAGKNKMFGVLIGSAAGGALAAVSPGNAGRCGVGIILALYLCHLCRLDGAGALSALTFADVLFGAARTAPWDYALPCVGNALLGIAVAVVVNLAVMPPNYAVEIKRAFGELRELTAKAMEDAAARRPLDTRAVAESIDRLSRNVYLYVSEAKVLRMSDDEVFAISSRIVVYRLVLDELKAVEVMELTESGEPDGEIRTVYHYHMKRMRELLDGTGETEAKN